VARSPTGEQLSYRMMALEAEIRDPHGHRIELGQWF